MQEISVQLENVISPDEYSKDASWKRLLDCGLALPGILHGNHILNVYFFLSFQTKPGGAKF